MHVTSERHFALDIASCLSIDDFKARFRSCSQFLIVVAFSARQQAILLARELTYGNFYTPSKQYL